MRTMLAVVLLLGGTVSCRTSPSTQPSPQPSPQPAPQSASAEPASLLRRVAEAADGYRDGTDRYVVADRNFPHHVLGAFLTREEADSTVAKARSDTTNYDVFGPFRTTEEPPAVVVESEEVAFVTVTTKDGKEERYDGEKVDAIFWGLTAFDKFIAPYLTVVSGVKYAAEQRELYRVRKSPLVHSTAADHYRTSF